MWLTWKVASLSFAARFTDWAQVPAAPTAEMLSRPWFLEVFSGKAWLTRAMRRRGWGILPPIDIVLEGDVAAVADVTDPQLRAKIETWLRSGCVKFVHFGTPCTTFSRARKEGDGGHLHFELTCSSTVFLVWTLRTKKRFAWALSS